MSPTTVLNHELAHATNDDNARNEYDANYYKDPAAALKKWNEYVESLINHDGNPRGSAEEQSVITRIEQRTAQLLGEINEGEVMRTNHTDGAKVRMESPISNIKIEE